MDRGRSGPCHPRGTRRVARSGSGGALSSTAEFRHGRTARRGAGWTERHERRRGDANLGRNRHVAAEGRTGRVHGRGRARRTTRIRHVRHRSCRSSGRAGVHSGPAPPTVADARSRLRRPRIGCRAGCPDHCLAQPCRGQRIQGVSPRRRAADSTRGHRNRSRHCTGWAGIRARSGAGDAERLRHHRPLPRHTSAPRPLAPPRHPYCTDTTARRRRRARAHCPARGRLQGCALRGKPIRTGPRVSHRRVPQSRGTRRGRRPAGVGR